MFQEFQMHNISLTENLNTEMEKPSEEERRCLEKSLTEDKNVSPEYCPRSWDHILCWSPTPPSTRAYQSCFEEFHDVQYDSSENATRWCNEFGQWNKTNYEACKEVEHHDLSGQIFLIGYISSFVVLVVAVIIFLVYRELRCLRNAIHTNLMCTYILVSSTWIIMWLLNGLEVFQNAPWLCNSFIIMLNFATLTNFFWMFVEGLYLYMLVVQTFTIENIRLRVYLLIGWGTPVPIVTIWAVVKSYEMQNAEFTDLAYAEHCPWMEIIRADWIYKVPALCILTINCIFLAKIMWVLITKLRSANSAETQQYRKAAKALLVLFPLLGITYVLTITIPTTGLAALIIRYIRDALISTQGLVISVFYCFFNSEVRTVVRHTFHVFRENRSIGNNRRRFVGSKGSPYVGVENVRLFGNQDSSSRARYHKRESGASDMTTVTYVGYCSSSNGRCRSFSGSTTAATVPSNKTTIPNNLSTNCV